jgi:hypothetical protein
VRAVAEAAGLSRRSEVQAGRYRLCPSGPMAGTPWPKKAPGLAGRHRVRAVSPCPRAGRGCILVRATFIKSLVGGGGAMEVFLYEPIPFLMVLIQALMKDQHRP